MVFTPEMKRELADKLDPKHVAKRQQSGRELSYIEGWHAIAEANRIFGFDGWTRETTELREVRAAELVKNNYGKETWRVGFMAKVRIVAHGVVREGTGFGSGAMPDMGDAIESAIKEAETDAMKRALMTFGNPFGLALYDKERANVGKPTSSAELKRNGSWDDFMSDLVDVRSEVTLQSLAEAWRARAASENWPPAWRDSAKEEINKVRDALRQEAAE